MLIQNQKNKINNLSNLSNKIDNDLNKLEINQIFQDKKLDIKSLYTSKRVITISSGWFTPTAEEENDEVYLYKTTLIACPIYLIPYIKITIIGKNEYSETHNYPLPTIRPCPTFICVPENFLDTEGNIIKDSIDLIIHCGVVVGKEVQVIITITNPREFI